MIYDNPPGAKALSEAPSPIATRCSRVHQSGERLHNVISMLESRLQSVAPAGPPNPTGELPRDKEPGPTCDLEANIWDMESMVNAACSRVDSLISRLKL